RDLLCKKTTNDRAACSEEAKVEQLEVDSHTPLYDGYDPEVTRLSFTLELLKTKANNKWTDRSLDELLKYLMGTCVLLVSMRPRRSRALLICRTLDTMHASMIASFIGRSTRKKTIVRCAMLLDTRRPEI